MANDQQDQTFGQPEGRAFRSGDAPVGQPEGRAFRNDTPDSDDDVEGHRAF